MTFQSRILTDRDLPIRSLCCAICAQPAEARMDITTDTSRSIVGACVRHIRFARRVFSAPVR